MKNSKLTILSAILSPLVISCANPYSDLDYAIAHSGEYDAAYEHTQDSLYSVFITQKDDSLRFETAYLLQKRYFYHNADSCCKYARTMLELSGESARRQILSNICMSRILARMDSLKRASYFLNKIPVDEIPKEYISMYYFSKHSLIKRIDPYDSVAIKSALDEWWQADSLNAECICLCELYFNTHTRTQRSIGYLEDIISSTASPNEYAMANYGLGMLYKKYGDEEKAIGYLIKSAETDMRLSVKEYGSLYDLSKILINRGDVQRASRYIQTTRKDAGLYNYTARFIAASDIEIKNLNTILAQEKRIKRILFIITPVIIVLLILTLAFLAKMMNSSRKLGEISDIKDNFLTLYMERCVDYLGKVDEFKSHLRHTAKHEGQDAVLAILRKPSFADYEFHKLLADFDAVFLGIFPDFIEKVNGIMTPEYRFAVSEENTLNTNLRILALIRLGISDRKKIAKILNMSVTTVYSYHTHLQQHSIYSSKEFDSIVKKL